MIRINLVRGKRKKKAQFNADVLYLLIPVLVLAALFVHYRVVHGRIDDLNARITTANMEVARLKKEIGEVEKFKARKAELQQKVDIISKLQAGRTVPVKVFEAISASIPEKCWIDQLSVNDNKVSLKGVALNNYTIANFMTALGESGRFQDVVLGSAEQATAMNTKLVKFNLTFSTVPD